MSYIFTSWYKNCYKNFELILTSNQEDNVSTTSYKNTLNNQKLDINNILKVQGNPLSNVDMSKQGVGSGAGYIEVSNGTFIKK